jgi:ABC-type lipoprotein export system ATPase subunit
MKRKREHADRSSLIVKSVDPKQKFQHPPVKFPQLPQHEFSLMMVAPPGSGKTNLLCWMILKLYKAYFHRIVVCSTTLDNDEKWNHVMKQKGVLSKNKKLEQIMDGMAKNKNNKKWKVVFRDEDDQKKAANKDEQFDGALEKEDMFMDIAKIFPILEEQQSTIEFLKEYLEQEKKDVDQAKYLADRMLIVLDDQAGRFDAGTNTPLNNFVIRHRHYSASVIIVTQAYKAIPRTIRTCMMQCVLFDIGSMQELKLIYEDRADCLDEKTWMEVYRHAVKDKPFSFLYFNYKFPPGQRFYKRFEKMITTAPDSSVPEARKKFVGSANDSKIGFQAKPEKNSLALPTTQK